jgi:hypothetical protein
MNSMLNSLLGIQGGGANDSWQLDQQIKQIQDQLSNMSNYQGVDPSKFFGTLGSALIGPDGQVKSLGDVEAQGYVAGTQGGAGKPGDMGKPGTVAGKQVGTAPGSTNAAAASAANGGKTGNAMWDAFMQGTGGSYGKGDGIRGSWHRWLADVWKNSIGSYTAAYNKALETDKGNQAVRQEQQQQLQYQLDNLNHAKQQLGGDSQGQGGGGTPLLDYLNNAGNMQNSAVAKQLSDQQSLAQQQASHMGMMNSSQAELAKGGNAIQAGQMQNQNARQNWQDKMSMIQWLQGSQAQQANQNAQNAQTQLGFTGQGLGVGTHMSDMEAQRQAAQAGYQNAFTMGQANMDSARANAAMIGMGQAGSALGQYYGQQSQKQTPKPANGAS